MRACAKSRCSLLMVSATTLAPKVFGDVFGEAAPSASDLEQPLAGLEIDGLGKPAVFVVLRGGEVGGVLLEQRRGIGHARVEPCRIERVADVVMRVDVAARLPPGIAVEPVPDDLDKAHQWLAAQHRLDQVVIDAEQIEELGQVRRVPFAVQISFGDADVAAVQIAATQRRSCRASSPPTGPARGRQAAMCGRREG